MCWLGRAIHYSETEQYSHDFISDKIGQDATLGLFDIGIIAGHQGSR